MENKKSTEEKFFLQNNDKKQGVFCRSQLFPEKVCEKNLKIEQKLCCKSFFACYLIQQHQFLTIFKQGDRIMANELDELTGPVNSAGRDINVIEKQLPVKVGFGSTLFEIMLWVCGILPGVIFLFMKIGAANYFRKLQQKIQADASQIDNYLEQRVMILQNVAPLVAKAIDLDKDVMKSVAAFRGGMLPDADRNAVARDIDGAFGRLFPQVEAYPELKAHAAIADAMQQNSYLQKEITAARALYNDTVNQWNNDLFCWPTKMIVAAKAGYTTRIPFTASAEIKARAREVFF